MIFKKASIIVLCFCALPAIAQEITMDSMPARMLEEVRDVQMDTLGTNLYVQTLTESFFNIQSFDVATNAKKADFNYPRPKGEKINWFKWLPESKKLAFVSKSDSQIIFNFISKKDNGLWSENRELINIPSALESEVQIYNSPNQKYFALHVKTKNNSSLISTFDADFNFLSFPSHIMKLESVFLSNAGKLILLGANQQGIKTLKVYNARNGELLNEKILSTWKKQNPKIYNVFWGSIFQYYYNHKENNLYVLRWVHLDYLELRTLELNVYELNGYSLENTFTKRIEKNSFDYGFSIGPTSIENNNVEYPLRLTYKYMETKESNVYICGTYQRMGKVEGEGFKSHLSISKATYFLEFSPKSFWMIPHSQIVVNYGNEKKSSDYQRNEEHFDLRTGTFVFYDDTGRNYPVLIQNDNSQNYISAINKFSKNYNGSNHSIAVVRRLNEDLKKKPLEKNDQMVLLSGKRFFQVNPSIIYCFVLNEGKPLLVKIKHSYQ